MTKVYPLGIVGEQHFQDAIRQCRKGERVYVCHEPDNPYDDLALKVETAEGRTIGYLPKDSWLRDAIHEQGRGVTATIFDIEKAPAGFLGVVLNVTLTDDEINERSYGKEGPSSQGQGKDGLARFVRKLFS